MKPDRVRTGGWTDVKWRHRAAQRTRLSVLQSETFDVTHGPAPETPYVDRSDCQHGCNGDPPCGSPCTFICHETLTQPERTRHAQECERT